MSAHVPDLHFFNNRGAKDIIPLYRDAAATQPNVLPGLSSLLTELYGQPVSAENVAAYCYGVLASTSYTAKFNEELAECEVRVPLTRDAALFRQAVDLGAELIWLHTFGERMRGDDHSASVPRGQARNTVAIPETADNYPETFEYIEGSQVLRVGGGEFAPVSADVWNYKVSGMPVLGSWLGYRMRKRRGKSSSPLDAIGPKSWTAAMTTELLHLLWILEKTISMQSQQGEMLERILEGELVTAAELPVVADAMRAAPRQELMYKRMSLFG